MIKFFYCLLVASKCLCAMENFADFSTAFQDPSNNSGTPIGRIVCYNAIGTLNEIIRLRDIDPYLMDPDNPSNPPFNAPVLPGAYSTEQYNSLMSFYSSDVDERSTTGFAHIKIFLETIHAFSSLSHTHPEFEVLSSFTSDLTQVMDDPLTFTQFNAIFQDAHELTSLREVIAKLMLVAEAIDNNQPRDAIQALEKDVSEALEKIPLIMNLAQTFYLPAVAAEYASMLGNYDHTTYAGRTALTRTLICYGELLKTMPDKKASEIAKVCMTFRDKAVKVLPRRLKALADNGNTEMITAYQTMNAFLQNLHNHIFANGAVPNPDEVVSLLKAWGYKKNGQSIAGAPATIETTPSEMLQTMREISKTSVSLYEVAFFDESNSVWSAFENGIDNYLRGVYLSVVEALPHAQRHDKEKELEAGRTGYIRDLKLKRLKEWPEILQKHQALNNAVTELNAWLEQIRIGLVTAHGPDTGNDLKTKLLDSSTRSSQARLWLRAQNTQYSPFNSSLSIYSQLTPVLNALSEEDFESLRLLGYTFAQTAKENIATLPALKPFETQIIKLRKIWAHPRVVDADWDGLVPSISTRDEKQNEVQALAILMVRLKDLLP